MRHYSPEAITNKNLYTSASDVYSFGNLIFEMVHVKHIFYKLSTRDATI